MAERKTPKTKPQAASTTPNKEKKSRAKASSTAESETKSRSTASVEKKPAASKKSASTASKDKKTSVKSASTATTEKKPRKSKDKTLAEASNTAVKEKKSRNAASTEKESAAIKKSASESKAKKTSTKSASSTKKSTKTQEKVASPAVEVAATMQYSVQNESQQQDLEAIPEGEYMNEAQRAYFKRMLEQWRDELIEEGKRTEAHLRDERPPTADLNDRASQEEEFYLELRTRERERKLLGKINKALLRLSRDEFGWCEQCGEEIGLRRLNARPTAELCIDCKEIAERQEKNFIH